MDAKRHPVPTHDLDESDDEKQSEKGDQLQLKREVGLVSAVALIVGAMIGSGIFISPKGVLLRSGSTAASLLVWLFCGVISLLGALCYAELGTVIPMSGGEYSYFLKAFGSMGRGGNVIAFMYAWTTILLTKPAAFAIMSLTFAEYIVEPIFADCQSPLVVKKIIAVLCITLVTAVNTLSVKLATRIQNIFTAAKLLAIAIIVFGGLSYFLLGHSPPVDISFDGTTTSIADIATASYFGLWAYEGWNSVNYITEELIEPHKNIPRAIMIAIPIVTVCYILTNIAYLTAMTPAELLATEVVAVQFAVRVLGPAAALIPLFVASSAYGAGNASCFTSGRLSFAAAREGHLPKVLSYVHTSRFTPCCALIFNSTLTILMVLSADIGSLVDFFSFAAWMFYGAAMATVILLRFTMKGVERPYKVPIIFPIIMTIISFYLVIAPIVQDPRLEYVYALLFIVSGLLAYFPFVYFNVQLFFMDSLTLFLQKLFEVAPTTKS